MLRHPAIRSCAVYGEDDADLGQRVHAVVESDDALTVESLRAFLADHIARNKWPRAATVQPTPSARRRRQVPQNPTESHRMTQAPTLTQFRLDYPGNGLVHLVFDCPGRTMNVFSEAAIEELGAFAAWLPDADVAGVLIRSGKDNAFCAGADLTELGVAYDMIMAAPKRARFTVGVRSFLPAQHRAARAGDGGEAGGRGRRRTGAGGADAS